MVESTALEMRHTGNRIGGSNPSLSATALNPSRRRPSLRKTGARARECSRHDGRRPAFALAPAQPLARLLAALLRLAMSGVAGIEREDQIGRAAHVVPFLQHNGSPVAPPHMAPAIRNDYGNHSDLTFITRA